MKVSVLLPVYNGEKYLAACLDSVVTQDFKDMEILVSDDCSTDGTIEIIKYYAARDARIRWWQNTRNLGQAPNHNVCLKAARGGFIKFIHADDKLLFPAALAWMVEILDKDDSVSLVGSASYIMDEDSRQLSRRNNFTRSGLWDGKDVIVKCLEANANLIGEPTGTLFRREQARRGFDVRYRQIMDMEMWFHLLQQGRFAYIAEPLFAYREHPQQETATVRHTVGCAHEYLALMTDYYRMPWMEAIATRQMLYAQIRALRERSGISARPLTGDMMTKLKLFWYVVYWLKRKVFQSAQKISKYLRIRC